MIDLNDMIVAQLKEKDAALPNVTKGVLVPMVCLLPNCNFVVVEEKYECSLDTH